ncbi:MAG: amidohydrolase family protein [Acidobacteriota bacterium]|nr:amidohydrolase family protein [Acidobacteriota bacterium]
MSHRLAAPRKAARSLRWSSLALLAFLGTLTAVGLPSSALADASQEDSPQMGSSQMEGAFEAASDVAAARALFEANLDAIRNRDRAAYLACYWNSENLVRSGPGGPQLGFDGLEESAGEGWPDFFDAQDLQLVPLRPGVVYGTYRYRVRYGSEEVTGLSERLFLDTEDGWRIAVTTAFGAPPGTAPPPLALVGGTLVDGTGAAPVENAVVVIEDGRIACAGSAEQCTVPQGMTTVDTSGQWITPGLVDAHIHHAQTAWADGRPDSADVRGEFPYEEVQASLRAHPEVFWRAHLCSGVTAAFDVGGYPWTWDLRRRAEGSTRAPHLAVAGPLLSTLDHWLNLPAERQFIHLKDRESAERGVSFLTAHDTDAVKVWFIPIREGDPEPFDQAVLAAGEEARERGVPLIVHATSLREAKVALRAGAHLLVHSVEDQPVDEEFIELAQHQGTIYCPTLIVREGYLRMYEAAAKGEAPHVDDPNGCVDSRTLERIARSADLGGIIGTDRLTEERLAARRERLEKSVATNAANLRKVHEAGIPIAMGTDAGNPLTVHGPSVYAEMEAMQAAGLTPLEVLVTATQGGARAMKMDDEIGTIEAGKIADLLLLTADPTQDIANLRQLHSVIRGGELRPLAELRASPQGESER